MTEWNHTIVERHHLSGLSAIKLANVSQWKGYLLYPVEPVTQCFELVRSCGGSHMRCKVRYVEPAYLPASPLIELSSTVHSSIRRRGRLRGNMWETTAAYLISQFADCSLTES